MSSKQRRAPLISGGALVAGLLLLNGYLLLPTGNEHTAEQQVRASTIPDGGVPRQRERIDQVIESVGEMNLEQCAEDLSNLNHNFEMAQVGGMSDVTGMPGSHLLQILADRRISRLYELLSALPPQDASRTSVTLYRKKLQKLRDYWQQDPTERSDLYGEVHPHAAECLLFLCAVFCDVELFLECVDRWNTEFGESPEFQAQLPDDLLLMSLYLMVLHDQKGKTIQQLNSQLQDLRREIELEIPEFRYHALYRWNAHTTNSDFTHRHRSVPTDREAILCEIAGLGDWPGLHVLFKRDKYRIALLSVRRWVDDTVTRD